MVAQLTIGSAGPFDLSTEEITDGYKSIFNPTQVNKSTQPKLQRWQGGEVDPLLLELTLVAGVSSGISSGSALVQQVGKILGMGIQKQGTVNPKSQPVSIGSWFKRDCFVASAKVTFRPPYDTDGSPMMAVVSLELIADGKTVVPRPGNWVFA